VQWRKRWMGISPTEEIKSNFSLEKEEGGRRKEEGRDEDYPENSLSSRLDVEDDDKN
jgi:hypothetical protein